MFEISPASGIGLYINGQQHISQCKPNTSTPHAPTATPKPPSPLCVGNCGSSHGTANNNVTFGNIAVTSTSVPSLLSTFQMGNFSKWHFWWTRG